MAILGAGADEVFDGAVEVICEGLGDGGKVGGVVLGFWEWVGDDLGRREHFGGVGFEEQAVGGDGAVGLEHGGFFRMKKIAGEGKAGTEGRELGDEFGGATEGMEEETVGGWGFFFEGF